MINPESIYYLFEAGARSKQEDYIWPVAGEATVNDKVFIVCDGAGSHYNGGTASELICQFMAAKVSKFSEQKMSGELIDKLLVEARGRLITYARVHRLDTDLATTFSMVILYDQRVLLSWFGDSRIYHFRGGEIIFRTDDHSLVGEPIQHTAIMQRIKADGSPIYAETKWIEDVQDGDYFLLCSRGIIENVMDEDIKLLIGQNDRINIDLTGSLKQLVFEKNPENYSMYLIKVKVATRKRTPSNGIVANRKQTIGMPWPIFVLAMTIVALLTTVLYFRITRTSGPEPKYRNQTTQPADAQRDDSVPSAIVMSAPRKPMPKPTDSVKNNREDPQAALLIDDSAIDQSEEKPEQTNQTPTVQKKREAQLLLEFTTDESCKLKITNIDLDEVIDWDLSQNDNGIIYLKAGKYSIMATSVINSSKTKTYHFDVKLGYAHTRQNLHIKF
jgi:serine/threonine protein phosphatase PrpC